MFDDVVTQPASVQIVAHVILFATTLVGILYQIYRDKRNRRWQLEDRLLNESLSEKVDKVSNESRLVAEDLGSKIEQEADRVSTQITTICDRIPTNVRRDDIANILRQRHMHHTGRRRYDGEERRSEAADGGRRSD